MSRSLLDHQVDLKAPRPMVQGADHLQVLEHRRLVPRGLLFRGRRMLVHHRVLHQTVMEQEVLVLCLAKADPRCHILALPILTQFKGCWTKMPH